VLGVGVAHASLLMRIIVALARARAFANRLASRAVEANLCRALALVFLAMLDIILVLGGTFVEFSYVVRSAVFDIDSVGAGK
jgi:hypothetical protein